jgi:hypothetical protein
MHVINVGTNFFNLANVIMNEPNRTLHIETLDPAMVEVLKSKTPAERAQMVAEANRTARILAAAGAQYLHPDWDETRIEAEVRRRVSGGSN